MAEYKLKLEKREIAGKKAKNLRKNGMIPSVIYGKKEPILAMSEYVATEKVLLKAGYHSPIDLEIDEKKQMAIVKDIQLDSVSRRIINIEFVAVSAKEAVVATTPIKILNFEASEASRTYHFEMTQVLEEIEVKAKPADLPSELTIDAEKLKTVDEKLMISDIVLPKGVEFADKEIEMEQIVASLYDPTAEAAAREAESVVEGEPEAEGEEKTANEAVEETSENE